MKKQIQSTMGGRGALPFLGVACAVGVASIYYAQPLLLVMGRSLNQDAREMSFVAVATQVGYACGILCFVPLGDILERRALMMRMSAGVSLALLLAAFAQGLAGLIVASVLIGLLASVTHVALPIAPDLVPEERRGHAIGRLGISATVATKLAQAFPNTDSELWMRLQAAKAAQSTKLMELPVTATQTKA